MSELKYRIATGTLELRMIRDIRARQLLTKMFRSDPKDRPQFHEIASHPWVTDDGFEKLDFATSYMN